MSRWYKTDFQIASPEGGFKLSGLDLLSPEGRAKAAELYVDEIKSRGIEVFAVTDHNSVGMLEEIRVAATAAGLTMFPGMELSTGTGSDGVHLLLIADPDADIRKLEHRWLSASGFNDDYPPHHNGQHVPAPRTLIEILNSLPSDTIAIAPHVLSENGVVNGDSIKEGTIRWQSLHHDRLEAIDVGTPNGSDGFNAKFRARQLKNFPALKRMAFLATSDAYEPNRLGRHTWIRMHQPNLDSLRQALLDHEARVICDWDEKAAVGGDPNSVQHPYIDNIRLDGLASSASPLQVDFDPRLTIVIGSRGAGKSTVVQGLRSVFGSTTALPESIAIETERYRDEVFCSATISATFSEALSGIKGQASWSKAAGLRVEDDRSLLNARIISQKELFERTSGNTSRGQSSSANMLALVDEALGDERVRVELSNAGTSPIRIRDFQDQLSKLAVDFTQAAERRLDAETRLAAKASLKSDLESIKRKLGVLDNPQEKKALAEDATIVSDGRAVDSLAENLVQVADNLDAITFQHAVETSSPEARFEMDTLRGAVEGALGRVAAVVADLRAARDAFDVRQSSTRDPFAVKRRLAAQRRADYQAKLADLGVDLGQYGSLQSDEERIVASLRELDDLEKTFPALRDAEKAAWKALDDHHGSRRSARDAFTRIVSARLETVRFNIEPIADHVAWQQSLRQSLALRSGDHVEAIQDLVNWLWDADVDLKGRIDRMILWRDALLANDYTSITAKLTNSFINRLKATPLASRLTLATERADDRQSMFFLKQDNDPADDKSWQDVTHGSPGQRSAAMLAFILSYGDSPLVLDQPEDDLDSQLVTDLVVSQLRQSRWNRQLIVVTHEANIPVNTDAERIVVLENVGGSLKVMTRADEFHVGPIDKLQVRRSIQELLEGGVRAFINRERRYNNELSRYRQDVEGMRTSL